MHALLGENGAGKTTLCNLLMGLYRPDEGRLFVGGKPVRFHSPREAQDAGIFMVHQHLRLVESMTVAENVVLGRSAPRQLRFLAPRRREDGRRGGRPFPYVRGPRDADLAVVAGRAPARRDTRRPSAAALGSWYSTNRPRY